MMTEDQYKRLMRRFTITWWLFGIVLVLLAILYFATPTTEVHEYRGEKGEPGQSIKGEQGPQGLPGASIVGPAGKDGEDGQTVINEKETVVDRTGDAGPKGDTGAPGREIELQRNQETGDVEWRYTGDTFWQVLIGACEISNTCEAEGGPGVIE